jgi:EAL domain-containing protein (putative c-di-GMP-specific phosphodiesterase class I)
VRWQHPTRGLLLPLEFLPVAEETGAIARIGAWVVREACRQLAEWHRRLAIPPDVWVSVNVSSVQFRDAGLFEQISGAVRDAGLDPRCLMIELTESTVMENPAAARGLVMQLRVMGGRIGLDDFGTGHSALSYLHQFPADFLKVDRSFVRGLETREEMAHIVRTVNDLADRLGLEVIAEGIERTEQLAVIRSLRCGYVQGFLLARPAAPERAAALLESGIEVPGALPADAGPSQAPERSLLEPVAGGRWDWRPLGAAIGAVILLVSAGLVARVVSGGRTAARTASPQAAALPTATASVTPPAQAEVPPASASPRATDQAPRAPARQPAAAAVGAATAKRRAPPAASPARTPAVAAPAPLEFAVVHLHRVGKCTGKLVVAPDGVSFVPDSSKDGFSLPYHAFLTALSDDALVIRSDKKAYRFKAPNEPVRSLLDAIASQSRTGR